MIDVSWSFEAGGLRMMINVGKADVDVHMSRQKSSTPEHVGWTPSGAQLPVWSILAHEGV